MKLFVISILIFNISFLFGQETRLDSLLEKCESAKDSCLPMLYNEIATEYLSPATLNKATEFAEKAKELAQNQGNRIEEAAAIKSLGTVAFYTQDYANALNFYEKSLGIKLELEDKDGSAALYYNIGIIHRNEGAYQKAVENYEQSLNLYKELKDTIEIASTYQVIGISYFYWSKYEDAVLHYQKSLEIFETINDQQGIANCMQVIGVIYHEWGDYEKALKYNLDAIEIFDELGNVYSTANSMMNIGIVYKDWGNYHEKALQYFNAAFEIMDTINNLQGVAYSLTNIGSVYEDWAEYLKDDSLKQNEYYNLAIEYHIQSLEIEEQIDDVHGIAGTLQSIGNVYGKLQDVEKSLEYNQKSLEIRERLGDKAGIAQSYSAIGNIYVDMKQYSTGLSYLNKSLVLAKELKLPKLIKDVYKSIAELFQIMKNYRGALEYYMLYTNVKDSLINTESHEQIAEMEEKYEAEKKEQQIELLAKEKELNDLELKKQEEVNKRQRFFIIGSVLVLIIITFFSIFSYVQLRQKKKVNRLLAAKNQEISDSIHYASRIQSAILPPLEYMQEVLPDHFVLDKPRDIVSGDFYWMAQKEEKIIIAAADCTGHGVPGAFMSMLGIAFLNEIVNQYAELKANDILNKLRANIINSLHQTGKEGEAGDGMDIALCMIDKKNQKMQFAGANNPAYLIRNNELREIKADKMPISIHAKADIPFTDKEIDIMKGDSVYLFSDGYMDQFGGSKGKKFKFKPFKEFLLSINERPMVEQMSLLNDKIEDWKGNLEQVDDILVIGLRIN